MDNQLAREEENANAVAVAVANANANASIRLFFSKEVLFLKLINSNKN